MKRIFASFLSVILLCSLAGCGKKTPAPEPPEAPETPSQTEEHLSSLPDSPLYLLTAEYNRLYAVTADGRGYLLRDAYCSAFSRNGQRVLAAFEDGSIYLYDLAAGTAEYITATKHAAHRLLLGDNSFFYHYATMSEEYQAVYHLDSHTESQPLEYSWNNILLGDKLAYISWKDNQICLTLQDLDTDRVEAQVPLTSAYQFAALDNTLYVQPDYWVPNNAWYRVDWAQRTLVPAEIDLPVDYGIVLSHGDAGFLTTDHFYNSEHPGIWIWKDGEATLTDVPCSENCWTQLLDEVDGKALLQSSINFTVQEDTPDSIYYNVDQYRLYDTATGAVTELPFQSETAKLFANGDFPLLDSSTARKPVTQSLYSLFCLQSQAGGAAPLCSTTHGAWTNLADRTVDIALLAEPTAEEQAYLKEKNVDIEMKLYGGDGLVFIGNDACGVKDLTLDQVRSIYRGEITNWSELGGVDADIHVLYRDDQSGSQRLFEKLVWKNEEIPDFQALGFEILDEMSSIVSCCIYDPYAIGYSIMTYLNDVYKNQELLAFSLNGVEASPEQVAAFKYPLGTQGYVVIRADEPENSPARRLYNWIGCPISDELLRNNSVTPLHG